MELPPTEWTLVNPMLTDPPTVNWLSHHEQAAIHTLPQFIAAWETNVVAFWRDVHCRDRSFALGKAAPSYVLPAPAAAPADDRERKRRATDDSQRPDKLTGKQRTADTARGDRIERAKRPIIRWKDSVPTSSRTPKALYETISKNIPIQPVFPAADLVRDTNKKKICFCFCLEGSSGGCKRKPSKPCQYAHIDGDLDALKGPDNFGSLTKFLALPQVAESLEYTARGRELSQA
jgi:hypothetical protein